MSAIGEGTTVTVPLWGLLSVGGGALIFVVGMTWRAFTTFFRKDEAIELEQSLRLDMTKIEQDMTKIEQRIEKRVDRIDDTMQKVASSVEYIRGRLEPQNQPSTPHVIRP